MGKRSDFERVPRDFYPTPKKAVVPLLPHIEKGATFAEPCCGTGDLVFHLIYEGYNCVWASDIENRLEEGDGYVEEMDALGLEEFHLSSIENTDYIITNPPWERSVLHPMIEHFSDLRPTWLLFDADWMHTKQAIPYLPRLRSIVSVGRVKWIPDSKTQGKDNCAWYLFDKPHTDGVIFYGRS